MVTVVVYSPMFLKHDQGMHPERAARLKAIMDVVEKSSIMRELRIKEPSSISEEDLCSVHSEDMVGYIRGLSETGGWLDFDTYVCPGSFEVAKLAAGGVVNLAQDVLRGEVENGFALVRPPGHHATSRKSMGFCLFNNVALAANKVAGEGKRVLIFDHDVHHGNGTQEVFYKRNDVLYQSFHLSPHYPGTGDVSEIGDGEGRGYTINAPLPRGAGDETVFSLLEEVFIPVAKQFKPDLIVISAGFDSHYLDQLGGLRLSANCFAEIIRRFKSVQPRVLCSLEGGYNLGVLGRLVLTELEVLVGKKPSYSENVEETNNAVKIVEEIKKTIGDYWSV
ncbi:MAG TPA: histone deacetylase [Thermoplasmatales archaeon]|nr:histone deacetylase [Thermoplasmatales archaeon]